LEGKEQYLVKIPNSFIALENLGDDVNINCSCESVAANIKKLAKDSTGYYELK
jgi:hypothetical protein